MPQPQHGPLAKAFIVFLAVAGIVFGAVLLVLLSTHPETQVPTPKVTVTVTAR